MTNDPVLAALQASAMAFSATVEGMKAENALRATQGLPPAYGEAHFAGEAASLHHIAAALRERG